MFLPFKVSSLPTGSHWPRGEWAGGLQMENGMKNVGNHGYRRSIIRRHGCNHIVIILLNFCWWRFRQVPVGGAISVRLATDGCRGLSNHVTYVEHVIVKLSLQASRRGEVQVFLISPAGTRSVLTTRWFFEKTSQFLTNYPLFRNFFKSQASFHFFWILTPFQTFFDTNAPFQNYFRTEFRTLQIHPSYFVRPIFSIERNDTVSRFF